VLFRSVIPAYNEAENIEHVIASIPVSQLADLGWSTEIVVVDNNSSDGTGELARACGDSTRHGTRDHWL